MLNFIERDNVKKFIESTYKPDEILKVKNKLLQKANFNPLEFILLLIGSYHDSKLPATIRLFAFYFLFLEEVNDLNHYKL